jgi:hypothetical protein
MAPSVAETECTGGLARRALKCGECRNAGRHHERKLIVQRKAGDHVWVAEIGTREERHARARRGGRQSTELTNQLAATWIYFEPVFERLNPICEEYTHA